MWCRSVWFRHSSGDVESDHVEGIVAESTEPVEGWSGVGDGNRCDCRENMFVLGSNVVWHRDSLVHDGESDSRGRRNQLEDGDWSGSCGWVYRPSRNTVVEVVCTLRFW